MPSREIAILDCAGSHFEMGQLQGQTFAERIQAISSALGDLLPVKEGIVPALLQKIASPVTGGLGRVGQQTIGRDLAKHFPHHNERARGIAKGAGVGEHILYVGQALERILNMSVYAKPPGGACTAVAVTGSRSVVGEPVIAKNFDYPEVALDSYLVRRGAAKGAYRTIDVSLAMLAGSHEGLNEHGLAVAYNYGHFKGRSVAAITITTLVQEILEQCKTVEEAIRVARSTPRVGGALLMLADATGATASMELGPDRLALRRGDALIHANHASTSAMRSRDIPWEATFPTWWPSKEVRGTRYHQSSDRRHQRAEDLMEESGQASEEELLAILADHGDSAGGDDFSLCRHGPYYQTTCSVLLFPKRRSMKICFGHPCNSDYEEIGFDERIK